MFLNQSAFPQMLLQIVVRYFAQKKAALLSYADFLHNFYGIFHAAVYLRGIRYVQLPTTLLAAVDSSVVQKEKI